jgi:tetratricopeptide (TPR) repeat protein
MMPTGYRMMHSFDVFLSYSSTDEAWVRRLAQDLKRYRVSVWLDRDEIRPGDRFVDALEQGMAQSRAIALVVSPASMASGWVKEMYNRAVALAQRQKEAFQLIPVLLHTAELPGFLGDRRWVDFRHPAEYATRVAELVWGITGERLTRVLDLDSDALPPLPRAYVPEPAPLPPGSRMPMGRNELFVGRTDELRALAEALQVQGTAAIGQAAAATGLGGTGKTQLAAEFAHRYGQFFSGGVFWLGFADPASVPAEVALCGGPEHLGLWSVDAAPDIATQVAMMRRVFAEHVPRLLVLDNCEDEELLEAWRPRSGGCRVLVTCRRRAFSPHLGVRTMALDVLPRADSRALLRSLDRDHRIDPADDATLDAICAELGDLPLALHLAGSFLARYRGIVTPAAYLAQLRDRALLGHPSLQGRGATRSPTGHDLHVGRTFALSWDRLDPANTVDAMARALLQRAACLAPGEPIPRALLVATLGLAEDDPDAALACEDALHRLLDLGLLDAPEPGTYSIHRLVIAFVQQVDADHAAARGAVEQALLDEAERVNDSGYPARLLPWQPHLRTIINTVRACEDERSAHLYHELGRHLRAIGDYRDARPYCERALAICETQLGPDHPLTAGSLNNLGALLQAQGAYAEALPLFERALAIREKQLGPDHLLTAASLNNLALLLWNQGAYARARPLYERALLIRERRLGTEHPLTAMSLNNLGALLQDQGAYAEARPLYERTLAICEKRLGPEHPSTATSLNNLASLLKAQGAYAEARPLLERALAIHEKQLGPEHPHTAATLSNLASLLEIQEAYADARPLFERTLAIREKQLGPDHPDTATSLNGLASLLRAQGAYAEARPLFQRALATFEARLGPDHPKTRMVRNKLQSLPES